MKTTKNDSTIAEIAREMTVWIRKTCYDEKNHVYVIVPENMILIEEKIAQALHRKDEEWKEKVRGWRMEKYDVIYPLKARTEEDIKQLAQAQFNKGYNGAVDEFNSKLDQLK